MLQAGQRSYPQSFFSVPAPEPLWRLATGKLAAFMFLLLPEDTSTGRTLNQTACRFPVNKTACGIAKTTFWLLASIIFSLLLGQLQ